MKGTKLYNIINSLSKAELNQFEKFIKSPFFNENEALVLLFETLISAPDLGKEKLWKTIKPSKPFNDVQFRRLCTDLIKLIYNFLSISAYQKQSISKDNTLLGLLNQKGLDKHFNSVSKHQDLKMEKAGFRNAAYYYERYRYEQHIDDFLIKSIQLTKKINLQQADKMLDCFYLTKKLKNYCNVLNYKNVLNLDLKLLLVDSILPTLETNGLLEIPGIAIYYRILQTLLEPDKEVHFNKLVNLLTAHGHLFPPLEIRDMYIFAQNYSIKKINTGHRTYFRSLFEIYQTILERGIIFKNGELLPWDYKNIVSLGLRLEEYEWIGQFIESYNTRLPKTFQENALTYNKANLHFHKGNYNKVIQLLSEVVYQDLYYALDGRWLLLKTYYELDEFEAMVSLMESFRIYLLRNKLLSKSNQRQYLNLIRFTRKLIRLTSDNPEKIEALKLKIEAAKEVAERRWLLSKVGALL